MFHIIVGPQIIRAGRKLIHIQYITSNFRDMEMEDQQGKLSGSHSKSVTECRRLVSLSCSFYIVLANTITLLQFLEFIYVAIH